MDTSLYLIVIISRRKKRIIQTIKRNENKATDNIIQISRKKLTDPAQSTTQYNKLKIYDNRRLSCH